MSIPALLVESALRATPLLGLVLAVNAARPHSAPATRHAALALGLFAFVAVPVMIVALPGGVVTLPWWLLPWSEPAVHLRDASAHTDSARALMGESAGPITIGAFLTAIWAAGAMFLLFRVAAGLVGTLRLRARAASAPGIDAAGSPPVPVVTSSVVRTPLVAGFVRPVILLPVTASTWAAADRDAVLAHELAHVRRRDSWTLLLALLVRAVYWPNPFVWLAVRRLRMTSEEACDRAVVTGGVPATEYAQLLLRLVRVPRPATNDLAQCMVHRHCLERRIQSLLHPAASRNASHIRMLTPAVLIIVVGCLGMLSTSPSRASFAAHHGISESLAGQILHAARAERISAALAFGLVSVESDFDAGRVSPRGAVGLTQVLPATAAGLVPGITPELLRDPDINLRVGFRLLHQYIERFDGNPERALVAYHSGPAYADRTDAPFRSEYPGRVFRAAEITPP